MLIVNVSMTVLDGENSAYAGRLRGVREISPLIGSSFTRERFYGVETPILAVSEYMSWRHKREDDALVSAGMTPHRYIKWWLLPAINSSVHALGVGITRASTGR